MKRLVYINSDLSLHYPSHFSTVYENLNCYLIGWSSHVNKQKLFSIPHESKIIQLNRNSRIFRIKRILLPALNLILLSDRKSTIIIHDDPIIFLILYVYGRLFFRNYKLIFRICHLFGENLLEFDHTSNLKRTMILFWIKLRNLSVTLANATIVMSSSMGFFLRRKYSLDSITFPVESTVEVSEFNRLKVFRSNAPEIIRMVYTGNIDLGRDFAIFLESLSVLKEKGINFEFDIYTTSFRTSESTKLLEIVDEYGLNEFINIKDALPHSEIVRVYEKYDVGIAIYSTTGCFRYNSPLKTLEYIASGLPWIGTNIPEHERLLRNAKTGFVYKSISELVSIFTNLNSNLAKLQYNNVSNLIDNKVSENKIKFLIENI